MDSPPPEPPTVPPRRGKLRSRNLNYSVYPKYSPGAILYALDCMVTEKMSGLVSQGVVWLLVTADIDTSLEAVQRLTECYAGENAEEMVVNLPQAMRHIGHLYDLGMRIGYYPHDMDGFLARAASAYRTGSVPVRTAYWHAVKVLSVEDGFAAALLCHDIQKSPFPIRSQFLINMALLIAPFRAMPLPGLGKDILSLTVQEAHNLITNALSDPEYSDRCRNQLVYLLRKVFVESGGCSGATRVMERMSVMANTDLLCSVWNCDSTDYDHGRVFEFFRDARVFRDGRLGREDVEQMLETRRPGLLNSVPIHLQTSYMGIPALLIQFMDTQQRSELRENIQQKAKEIGIRGLFGAEDSLGILLSLPEYEDVALTWIHWDGGEYFKHQGRKILGNMGWQDLVLALRAMLWYVRLRTLNVTSHHDEGCFEGCAINSVNVLAGIGSLGEEARSDCRATERILIEAFNSAVRAGPPSLLRDGLFREMGTKKWRVRDAVFKYWRYRQYDGGRSHDVALEWTSREMGYYTFIPDADCIYSIF